MRGPSKGGATSDGGGAARAGGAGRRRRGAALALAAGLLGLVQAGQARQTVGPDPASAAKRAALEAYGKLPLAFVENRGQSNAGVHYSAQGPGYSFGFARGEALFSFVKGKRGYALRLHFLGSSKTRPEGAHELPGKVNYLLGSDPAKWRTTAYGFVVGDYVGAAGGVERDPGALVEAASAQVGRVDEAGVDHERLPAVAAMTCSDDRTMGTIYGRATVDGTGNYAFRIDVTDQGEPGTNDSYGIILSDGYASGQKQLQGGNVQIHKS